MVINADQCAGCNNPIVFTESTGGVLEPLVFIHTRGNTASGPITARPPFTLDVRGPAANTTGVWGIISDARLKKNIKPLNNALDTILKLQGVTFKWKDSKKGKGRQLGFIAQDVEKVIPEWVKTEKQGYKWLEKQGIEALFVEAIKELHVKN